jgi:CRP/FNR family transcriptional regulator
MAAPALHQSQLWTVRNLDLFRSLSEEAIAELASNSLLVEFGKNEPVCMSGVKHTHAYLIKEGTVRLVATSPTGKRLTISILKPGELIGDLDLFGGDLVETTPGESAEAMDGAILLQVPVDYLRKLVKSNEDLTLQLYKLAGRRRMVLVNRVNDVLFLTVQQRLARLILRLAEEFPGLTRMNRRFVNLRLTHAELADLIGSNREAVSANLAKMKREKLMVAVEGRIVIYDEDRLKQVSEPT